MNSFLLSKNPPAAVWKTALRILGIAMLSFLFISEGWGQGDQPLDVSNITIDGDITLTYKAKTQGSTDYAWFYKVGSRGKENEFSGTLTTDGSSFSSEFFFNINNNVNATPTPELTLNNFHYSGTNGVFRIYGTELLKITADNACTLKCTGEGTTDELIKKSVIYVGANNVELNGGTAGMTIENTMKQSEIAALYTENATTTTLSGKINLIAKNDQATGPAYAIRNRGTLSAGNNIEIKAIGDNIYEGGKYLSPFMIWNLKNAPQNRIKVIINKLDGQTESKVTDFDGDGQSKSFLILGEKNALYTVYVNGEKQMGKINWPSTQKGPYTDIFAAATDENLTEWQQSFYNNVTDLSQLTLDLSTVTDKLSLHYQKGRNPYYAWFYKIGDGQETEFSGTLTGTNPTWTHGAISISNTTQESDYATLKLDGVMLTSSSPLIEINTGSQPVCLQAINKSTLKGDGNVINITGSSILLDGGNTGLEIIGTGQASHGIHLTGDNGKAAFEGEVTVNAGICAYLTDKAKLSANPDANVKLYSSSSEAISFNGAPPSLSLDASFLEWRFDTAPTVGTLEVKDGDGNSLVPAATFATGNNSKNFATNVKAGTYTLWLGNEQQMGQLKSAGGTSEDTKEFQLPTGQTLAVYTSVTKYTPKVTSLQDLESAIESASPDPNNPTKITLGADIDLSSLTSNLTINGKHIEIDGGGHTITPHTERGFFFTASAGSLKLTNVTVDFEGNPRAGTNAFIDVEAAGTEITLGTGFRMINGASNEVNKELPYAVNMYAGTLIMEGDAEITQSTDEEGCAVKLLSAGTLKLRGGKIHGNRGTGLYLKKDGNSNPQVIIEQSLANSQFDGICLADYIDAQGNIPEPVVISAGNNYSIEDDDVSKLGLKAVLWSGIQSDTYELYLDTDNKIKFQSYLVWFDDVTYGTEEVGYSPKDAYSITIWNESDSPLTIDKVTLAGEDKDNFTIISSGNIETVPARDKNTNYAVRPKDGLPIGDYAAKIQVTAKGHTGIYEGKVSFEVIPSSSGPDDPDPTPTPEYVYYQVVLPQVTGATTDPVAGTYVVGEGNAFRFKLSLDDDYNLSVPAVQAGDKVLQPDAYGYYLIPNVWHDQTISITGITLNPVDPPSANADAGQAVRVWSEGRTLYIHTTDRETIRLYTFGGRLLKQMDNAGRIAVRGLPEGNYLIRIGNRTWKIAL